MSENRYVYPYSSSEAKHNNEIDTWRNSYRENIACSKAIDMAIKENFDGMHLNAETAKQVITEFGYDRVNWVLANTIQRKSDDGRFSSDNKQWAKGFYIPVDKPQNSTDRRLDFVADAHPAVLDGFVNQARQAYVKLNLFDHTHCHDKWETDMNGKVFVLNPSYLKDECKNQESQLWLCTGGFGANPHSSGRAVYGTCLSDGEETRWDREQLLGVIKDEHLPDWAAEKLQELTAPKQDGMSMA